ncbi:hypothetical protein PCASD_02689 [Puccinia coronata f. sp. avenae]|uniref:Uncharacterized protein n=1 Tax=Puccinia coronata f. sp. avenae TaxID=200324 RepID=A0A2N5VH85_9BASI|nr:hypothetical protein PCASD_02689 [Puccinia coronata f. sp. avenae]
MFKCNLHHTRHHCYSSQGDYVLDFCRVFSPQSPVYSHHMLFIQKLDWTKQSPPPQPVNNKAFSALIFAGHRAPLYTSISWVPNRNQAEDRSNGSNDHQGVVVELDYMGNRPKQISSGPLMPTIFLSPPLGPLHSRADGPSMPNAILTPPLQPHHHQKLSVMKTPAALVLRRRSLPHPTSDQSPISCQWAGSPLYAHRLASKSLTAPPPSDWAHIAKPLPAAASPEPGMASVRARGPRHLLAST